MNALMQRTLVLAGAWLIAAGAAAQNYTIDWFTIDGGGGTSTGGVNSVSGTIGQPDAGPTMSGGDYSLTGGFWALYAVQTPGAPLLRIITTGANSVVVAWPAPSLGFTLQQNSNLDTSNWLNVTTTPVVVGAENHVSISPLTGRRFYRLSKP